MSERFFDDLARTLASPMPRRRALRLAGAALVTAAIPTLRPRSAFASPCGPDTPCSSVCNSPPHVGACGTDETNSCGQVRCRIQGCLLPGDQCCRAAGGDPWICPKDTECGKVRSNCIAKCPSGQKCGDNCCVPPDEECVDGECVPCRTRCGGTCCEDGKVCVNPRAGLCCLASWVKCEAGAAGIVKCCPPRDTCAVSFKTKTAKCCGPKQKAVGAGCTCKNKGETVCGNDCCTKSETCSKGMCCPKGKVNCGNGQCCKPSDCCGKTCCGGKGQTCVGGKTCCPTSRRLGSGTSAKCCPPGTVASQPDTCCPPNDPSCCDLAPLGCSKGQVCVAGACATL